MGIIRQTVFFMLLSLFGTIATSEQTKLEAGPYRNGKFCGISNADTYVSNIVGNVKNYLKAKYDPLLIKETGAVRNLKVEGLGSIERVGKALMQIDKDFMKHEFNISFKTINAEAEAKRPILKILGIWMTGTAHATIKGLKLYGVLRIDLKECTSPRLEVMKVNDWGVVYATMQNGNWIGRIASWFPAIITHFIKKDVPKIIENVFGKVLGELKL